MSKFRLPWDQDGSTAVLLVIALMGFSLLGLMFISKRVEGELRAEEHEELLVDKLKVRSALLGQSDCQTIDFEVACAPGSTLSVPKKAGGTLVAADGSTVIGKWNARIECLNKTPAAYFVTVARLGKNSSFLKDPLTGKPLSWAELMPLQDACGLADSSLLLLKSDSCYGTVGGSGELPPEVTTVSSCTSCRFASHYCTESQREFPACPSGYRHVFRYVDRYGWGGIDLTKYTICSRL